MKKAALKTKSIRYLALLRAGIPLLLAFAAIFSPLVLLTTVHQHEAGANVGCPFMIGEAAPCQMSVLQHILSWQVIFTSLPLEVTIFTILLLGVALLWAWLRRLFRPPNISSGLGHLSSSYSQHHPSPASLLLGNAISPRAP